MKKQILTNSIKVQVTCSICNKVYSIGEKYRDHKLKEKSLIKCRSCSLIKWSLPLLKIEAAQYTTKGKFQAQSGNAYHVAQQRGLLKDICGHMVCGKGGIFRILDSVVGIYELYENNELVYIGKSFDSIGDRLYDHYYRKNDKFFNKVIAYIIKGDSDINVAEIYLINKMKPKYNKGDLGKSTLNLCIDNIDSIIIDTVTIDIKNEGYENEKKP